MHNDFYLELRRLIGLSAICLVIGMIIDQVLICLLVGYAGYIIWTLAQIRQLEHWLQNHKRFEPPDASGIWGYIFDHLNRQKKQEAREQRRLKRVIRRVEDMTAALNDAVIVLSNKYTIDWLNKTSRSLLPLKKRDIGSPITNFIRYPQFVKYLEKNNYDEPLIINVSPDVDKRLEFRLIPVGNGELLMIVRDVTRIYRLEQMRKDFVADVSHELRTPLTVITGYLETLEGSLTESRWEKPLQQMQQQSARMTSLINDLTMLSKLETDQESIKNISAVPIKSLLEMIHNEIQTVYTDKKQTLTIKCPSHYAIQGNDRQLHSAFTNLLTNAIKYSPEGKNISILVETNFTGGLDVKFIDKGFGIEAHHIHRLTERFYRIDTSRSMATGGTGLGLAIVKHVLMRHDARLHIRSRLHHGSTFIAMFPKSRVIILDEQPVVTASTG